MTWSLGERLTRSFNLKITVLALILASHIVPTLIIGFGYVIPGTCVDGMNPLMLGFISCVVGFVPTFVCGVIAAWRFGRMDAVATPPALG